MHTKITYMHVYLANLVGYVISNFTVSFKCLVVVMLKHCLHFNIYLPITYFPLVSEYTFLVR